MISFIIPAYNSERTLKICLESVFQQTIPKDSYEVIVVNNNSSDKTPDLAKNFPVTLINEASQGRSFARNTGAKIAKGKFLAFLDSDVILQPDWAEQALKGFEISTVAGVAGPVVPSLQFGCRSLNNYRKRSVEENTLGTFNILHLLVKESPMINTAACMYLKVAFEKVNGFDPVLKRHEDIDLSKRLLLAGYDLASVPAAKAEVIFNGEGWLSYFRRTFEDGYTKHTYLLKWKDYHFRGNRTSSSSLASMFFKEVVLNFVWAFLKMDVFYFVKALNSSIKSTGRLVNMLTFGSVPKYQCGIIREKAHVFESGIPMIEFDMKNKTMKRIQTRK